jgi:hypothetical protein
VFVLHDILFFVLHESNANQRGLTPFTLPIRIEHKPERAEAELKGRPRLTFSFVIFSFSIPAPS